MRIRLLAAALAAPLSSHALAFDPGSAGRYPSPDLYRPNVDRIIINGSGSTGDVSRMSVRPTGSPASQTLADLLAQRLTTTGNDLSANPDASISDKIPFGNTGAKHFLYSHRDGPQNSLLGTTAIIRNTVGSGTFGPGAADYALLLSAAKDKWQTSNAQGELNALVAIAQQGKRGDGGAFIANVTKRRDALQAVVPDEDGGAGVMEGAVALVDANGKAYHRMHALVGFAEHPSGFSKGLGYGTVMETRAGTWFSAYHASSMVGEADETGDIIPNAWTYYFSGAQSRDPKTLNYMVDNTGRTFSGYGGARMSWGMDNGLGALTFRDETGNVERMRLLREGGGLTVFGRYASLALSDPTTGAAQRITSAGDGSFFYQVATAPDFATAANVFSVAPDGTMTVGNLMANGRLLTPVGTPGSSAAACSPGQMSADGAYIYICVAANKWRRTALADF